MKGFVLKQGFCFKKGWMIVVSERRRILRKVLIEVSEEVKKRGWLFRYFGCCLCIIVKSKMLSDSLGYLVIVFMS